MIPIEVNKLNDRILFIKTGETSVLTNMLAVSTDEGIIVFDSTWHFSLAGRVRKIIEKEAQEHREKLRRRKTKKKPEKKLSKEFEGELEKESEKDQRKKTKRGV